MLLLSSVIYDFVQSVQSPPHDWEKFLFRLLENAYNKIDLLCFYLCIPVSISAMVLPITPSLKEITHFAPDSILIPVSPSR